MWYIQRYSSDRFELTEPLDFGTGLYGTAVTFEEIRSIQPHFMFVGDKFCAVTKGKGTNVTENNTVLEETNKGLCEYFISCASVTLCK
jgi:hypothetical protein